MAEPIKKIKKKVIGYDEKKAKSIKGLTNEIADHDEAMLKMLAIVTELHESGILEGIDSFFKAKSKITEIALGQVNRNEVTTLINHVMEALGALTTLDPNQTKLLVSSLSGGLKKAKEDDKKKVTVFSMIQALNDPDISRALSFGLNFLKGFGKGLD